MFSASRVIYVTLTVWCCKNVWGAIIPNGSADDFRNSLQQNCDQKFYTTTCMKLKVLSFIDQVSDFKDYRVFPGLSIVREENATEKSTAAIIAEVARDFPKDSQTRLDAFLLKRVGNFIDGRALKFSLFDEDKNVVTGRRKSQKGYGMYVIGTGAMMGSMMMAMKMAGIAAIAGKALMTAMVALALSAAIGLKALSKGSGKTTYEVITKPVHEHGWSSRTYEMQPIPKSLTGEYRPY